MFDLILKHSPALDPDFIPAVRWNDCYKLLVEESLSSRDVSFRVKRSDGDSWTYRTRMLGPNPEFADLNFKYAERLFKFIIWAWGGSTVEIAGAPELAEVLREVYSPKGTRSFDYDFMGRTCFLEPFEVLSVKRVEGKSSKLGGANPARDVSGCRIGFDLGGSDRKCAAVIDGEVVFSEEVKWDPYFQSDPEYHLAGLRDSLKKAASKLPRVDAIGGSAAGVYVSNEPRVASLFRGVSQSDFDAKVRSIFKVLAKEWGDVPFVVANDGDVTALAGAMSFGEGAVLGVSMGTSEAGGYVDGSGNITGWLNELAFAPVDYRSDAPVDEWSGDRGCGVQYFSQQAVGRLIPKAGFTMSDDMPLPEKLEAVQEKMKQGDERAAAIYKTIGSYFGYSIAHYADFYNFEHLLFLGRVSSGEGGDIVKETAELVLEDEFPELAERIGISMPDEAMKRHGQAVAAAILPTLKTKVIS